ncbi:MAG: copper chaperone PCu(A)C [Thalassospira sp.]|uniref:copper chaperone PCu(A)C n=1 Tax=Thalassospira sp. TaxID=1912094 RepID=UPI001B1BD6B2|nr:copper chaperone PCu(A)C [Thalassospira sp.]MBO6578089.1 copper chaperone PCu(A)C [Thalassospira sp.]MBO6803060.1 copper chaperone PCu(A)C [Thalassospira sp.]MBO6818198.1 copper chaperone PCu(A)C [Thalassospira sp.]MBO6887969.1 copper chaperone PCu(A)C [Thalassospira sp.]
MKKLFAIVATIASLFIVTNAFAADIEVKDAWAKASKGMVRNGAAFFDVVNAGAADRIVSVRSDLAERTELHTHIMENNVMKMRQVQGGVDVPMHGSVQFKPGSYHIMFIGLNKPLEEGEKIDITLEFEKAGDVPVTIDVLNTMAMGPNGGAGMGHGHGKMKMNSN